MSPNPTLCGCTPAPVDHYRCPNCSLRCGNFDTEVLSVANSSPVDERLVCRVTDIETSHSEVIGMDCERLNAVLGGGVTMGGVYLLGGPPGAGKSTILMEVARGLLLEDYCVLYVSAEERPEQARDRCERLCVLDDDLYVCCETNITRILEAVRQTRADLVLLDSIQRLHVDSCSSAPGSPSQVQAVCEQLLREKPARAALFIVGHVTKAGDLAGPKFLEHMVDVVLSLVPKSGDVRRLSSTKNRFGACCSSEFTMTPEGLR